MAIKITLPASPAAYSGGYQPIRSLMTRTPPEAHQAVAMGVDWSKGTVFLFDLSGVGVAAAQLSQIATLFIDNTLCTHAVTIVLPDTGQEFTAPALSTGFYPIITNQLKFFAFVAGFTAGDQTNIFALNYFVTPANISENTLTLMQSIGSNGQIREFVLGDLYTQVTVDATIAGLVQTLILASNWVLSGMYMSANQMNLINGVLQIAIGEMGAPSTLFNLSFQAFDGTNYRIVNGQVLSTFGMQSKNIAKQPLQATLSGVKAVSGSFTITTFYSILPAGAL